MRWDQDCSTTHFSLWWTGVHLRQLRATIADANSAVDGWVWSISGGEWDDAGCASLLNRDETSYMEGLPQARRRQFLRNHAMLRVLLGAQQLTHPRELALTRHSGGKPRFADPTDRHFNLSHSDSFGALGVSRAPIGIDIECPRHINYRRLAHRLFPNEARFLPEHRDAIEDNLAFARLWTAKESYLKALGCGLSKPLNSFTLQIDSRGRAHGLVCPDPASSGADCKFFSMDGVADCPYVGTLAVLQSGDSFVAERNNGARRGD
jgi:4'-phosphopantetheinyl transferase